MVSSKPKVIQMTIMKLNWSQSKIEKTQMWKRKGGGFDGWERGNGGVSNQNALHAHMKSSANLMPIISCKKDAEMAYLERELYILTH